MNKPVVQPIENQLVRLRLLKFEDLPLTLTWRNQEEIRKWFFHSDILSYEQHLGWFERYQTRDDDFVFIIEEVTTNLPVGLVALYNMDAEKRCAEFGRLMIGEKVAQGKGYAKAALNLILRMAFTVFELQEVYLEVFANNERAISVYEKCNFHIINKNSDVVKMVIDRQRWAEG